MLERGDLLRTRLGKIAEKENRIIVGIEPGDPPDRPGAAIVEISGSGENTILDLHYFHSIPLPGNFLRAIRALADGSEFDGEDVTGVSFLLMHSLSNLFQTLLDLIEADRSDVDLIGLRCLEVNGKILPEDLTAFSEMTGRIVASKFGLVTGENGNDYLPLNDQLFQGMVGDMVEKFGLEDEVRKAVGVALLANESLFYESSEERGDDEDTKKEHSGRLSLQTIKRTGNKGRSFLRGQFFFPE